MKSIVFNKDLKTEKFRYFSEDFRKKRVKELEVNLTSISDICKTYNVSRSAVYKWIYKYSIMAKKNVRQVVELYHGKIEVESTPGTGFVFIVTLPKNQ